MLDMPYFMENKSWYTYDVKKRCYVLTDKAPEKAKKSYKEYYKELGSMKVGEVHTMGDDVIKEGDDGSGNPNGRRSHRRGSRGSARRSSGRS